MLLAAMEEAGVPPHEALMVGFDYVDREAAHAAETNYLQQEHLLGRFDSESVGKHLMLPGEEVQSTVTDVLEGYNSTIFAYGQTGAGK